MRYREEIEARRMHSALTLVPELPPPTPFPAREGGDITIRTYWIKALNSHFPRKGRGLGG